MSDAKSEPRHLPFGADDVSERLQRFVDTAGAHFEASADDLVRVRVNSAFQVVAIELLDLPIEAGLKQRLETAITGALNTALQRAALAAVDALAELEQRAHRESAT